MDNKTIQPAAPIKPIITVWAGEKGPLGDGHYEFSFCNGSSGSEHAYGGYCMSAPGRIVRGSLTATESIYCEYLQMLESKRSQIWQIF